MHFEMMEALEHLERERGIPVETILDALANALVSAYKRSPGAAEEARVTIDPDTGEMLVYAQELDDDGNVVREWEDTPDDFGRIAAQTAKQVIQQRLRDAKREQVYDRYQGRQGDLVTGIVQQVDHRYAMLDLGDAEAIMPSSERIPYERLDRGARVKALVLEVREEGKGAPIVVSRSHPDFIKALFELEVPELLEGVVEIRAIAREPGHRTKLAVFSNDPSVDPVGACVGARGSRVRQVVNELRGEKVDLVQYRDDQKQFIAEALSPVRGVREVRINDEENEAVVIVPDGQLSLAIGKEGQNARLAARLTGYRIDIRPESNPEGLPPRETGETSEDGALAPEGPAQAAAVPPAEAVEEEVAASPSAQAPEGVVVAETATEASVAVAGEPDAELVERPAESGDEAVAESVPDPEAAEPEDSPDDDATAAEDEVDAEPEADDPGGDDLGDEEVRG